MTLNFLSSDSSSKLLYVAANILISYAADFEERSSILIYFIYPVVLSIYAMAIHLIILRTHVSKQLRHIAT